MIKNKYNKKLILDYISGNDIEGITIEELENDCEFMIEVIKYTKDKNMYNLCSNEIKNNYIMVRFMIETFKDDIKFISEISTNYLGQVNNGDITARELTILMNNIIGENEDISLSMYGIQSMVFYSSTMLDIEITLNSESEYEGEFGKGFILIKDMYNTSSIIIDFFAKKMINEIFYSNKDCNFEELIHRSFKIFNELEDSKINKYLINYINSFDNCLSSYVSCHLELLEDLKNNVNKIIKNWDKYIDGINKRRIDIFNQEISKYIEENGSSFNYSIVDFIDYVMKKLKLEDTFKKYDDYSADIEMFGGINPIDENKLDLSDLKCLRYVTNLTKELFKEDIINENPDDYDKKTEQKDNKSKILHYDFMKNNKKNNI